jgi:hypothetical protein
MAPQTRFITFATGPYELSADRLGRQVAEFVSADSTPIFSEFRKYTLDNLKADPVFWQQHGQFIEENSRGIGYWLWKPYLVLQNLDEMDDGDTLIYADAGCYLQTRGTPRLEELINLSRSHPTGIVVFNSEQPNQAFNKADVFDLCPEAINKTQIVATAFFVTKNQKSRSFFEELYQIAQQDNYHLLTDAPSRKPNPPTFQTHRHDQSIFTMLAYKYNIYVTPTDETWDGPKWEDWSKPIYAARRKGY